MLNERPLSTFTLEEFVISSGYPERIVTYAVSSLIKGDQIVPVSNGFYLSRRFNSLKRAAINELAAYHKTYPDQEGMPIERFRAKFNGLQAHILDAILMDMLSRRIIKKASNLLSVAGFKAQLAEGTRALMDRVMALANKSFTMPITFHRTLGELVVDEKRLAEAIRHLIKQGRLIRIYKNRSGNREEFITPEALDIIKEKVAQYILENGGLTLEDAKGLFPIGRRVINILDYLDSISFTMNKNLMRTLYPRYVAINDDNTAKDSL